MATGTFISSAILKLGGRSIVVVLLSRGVLWLVLAGLGAGAVSISSSFVY